MALPSECPRRVRRSGKALGGGLALRLIRIGPRKDNPVFIGRELTLLYDS